MRRFITIAAALSIAFAAGAQQTTDGIRLYNYHNYVSAQKVLTPLAGDAKANYYLGLSYLESGSIDKAKEQFAKFPDDAANASGMARVAYMQGDAAKGTQLAKDLAAKAKKKDYAPLLYAADAITYTEGGDIQQAIEWYKKALVTAPNDPMVHLGLADANRKITGGGGEAMNNYEWIIEKEPKNSLVLTRIGDLWYEARNYTSALEFYNKAKEADPSNPLPYRALSLAYQRTAKYDAALTNIRQYLDHSDNTVSDKINFAGILYQSKNYCEAAKTANELMKQTVPADKKAELVGILGFSQAECGDSMEAVKNIRTYLSIQKPKNILPATYIEYGKLWMKLNNVDSASYYYNRGIEADTAQNKTDVYRQIAEAYKSKKEYCKAGEWYGNLIKANPNTQPLDYFWGTYMYYYCHDLNKANKLAEAFEAKYPEQVTAYYWHARVQAAVDSEATTGLAVASFEKWLDKLGADISKPEKKSDVIRAYQYLVFYNYNVKDKEKTKMYMEKLRAVDPADGLIKQIEDSEKNGGKKPAGGGKPAPKAGTKAK